MSYHHESGRREQGRQVESTQSKELLQDLSKDVIPIIYPDRYPTLAATLQSVIKRTKSQINAIERGEITPEEAEQNFICFIGLPGSGKSHCLKVFNEALEREKIPSEHILRSNWEDADIAHQDATIKRGRAKPLNSDKEMMEANVRAINSFNSKDGWLLATGEYAPIVRRNRRTNKWEGRDGGATFLEHVFQESAEKGLKRRFTFVGLCAGSSLDYFITPNRTQGAYYNQSLYYTAHAKELTRSMYDEGELRLPPYIADVVENGIKSNPLEQNYPPILREKADDVARFLLKIRERDHMSLREQYNYTDPSFDLTPRQRFKFFTNDRLAVAQNDCTLLSSLYLMNLFLDDIGVNQRHIFMGMMAPPVKDLNPAEYSRRNYINNFDLSDYTTNPE